jgi:hypothetical protein
VWNLDVVLRQKAEQILIRQPGVGSADPLRLRTAAKGEGRRLKEALDTIALDLKTSQAGAEASFEGLSGDWMFVAKEFAAIWSGMDTLITAAGAPPSV